MLRSPDVDFLASPFSYADRELGTGLLIEHVPLASLHAHGKAFFDENDLYPHTNQPDQDDRAKSISVGVARTPEETLLYTRLAFMQAVVRGKHQWLTELTGWVGPIHDNFTDEAQLIEIQRLNGLADQLVRMDRHPVAEVAFVIDEKGVSHLTRDNTWFRDHVYRGCVAWGHTGAPFDVLLLEDLPLVGDRYRLVVPLAVFDAPSRSLWDSWKMVHPSVVCLEPFDGLFQTNPDGLLQSYSQAGVHRFVEDAVTVWANRSMVGVHVASEGRRLICFLRTCKGREVFTGHEFSADEGKLVWDFETNGVALFVIE
jgi:hypothetical protein